MSQRVKTLLIAPGAVLAAGAVAPAQAADNHARYQAVEHVHHHVNHHHRHHHHHHQIHHRHG